MQLEAAPRQGRWATSATPHGVQKEGAKMGRIRTTVLLLVACVFVSSPQAAKPGKPPIRVRRLGLGKATRMEVMNKAARWVTAVALACAAICATPDLAAAGRAKNDAPAIKVQPLFETGLALRKAKSAPVIQNDPDPNLQRFQFRCKREADWPDACPAFSPAQIYPEVSTSDYAFGMYTDFDGETPSYRMTYTDSAGGTESVNFTLDPSFCGSGGYSYYLLFQTTRCAYGGIYIAFLYPHAHGRLTATVKAQSVIVFYQLLDVMPHIITKANGANGDGQHGLLNTALRGPLSMVMKDFEGNIPH